MLKERKEMKDPNIVTIQLYHGGQLYISSHTLRQEHLLGLAPKKSLKNNTLNLSSLIEAWLRTGFTQHHRHQDYLLTPFWIHGWAVCVFATLFFMYRDRRIETWVYHASSDFACSERAQEDSVCFTKVEVHCTT